jgi:hypothetical protein
MSARQRDLAFRDPLHAALGMQGEDLRAVVPSRHVNALRVHPIPPIPCGWLDAWARGNLCRG